MINISIAMSTYNGEKNLEQQIVTLLNQKEVWTSIFIRDDGSSDRTVDVIKKMQKQFTGRIEYEVGANIGYKKSFLKALSKTKEADYYAFSDQDDFWLEEKCIQAVKKLQEKKCVLYASAQILTDENLHKIGIKSFSDMKPTLESEFTRHRLPGCTFVFDKKLKKLVAPYGELVLDNQKMPSHDMIVACLALAIGDIYIDESSYIKYRRLDESLTPGGQGVKKRIKHEMDYLFHNQNRYSFMAGSIIEYYSDLIQEEKKDFLINASEYKNSLRLRYKLFMNPKMDCGIVAGNIENRIKVLLGTY